MKQKISIFFLSTILCAGNIHAQDVPNAADFLPGPPSSLSMKYANDYMQYAWGKSVRNTAQGAQAKTDMSWDLDSYLKAFSPILGVELSTTNTPNIHQVLEYGIKYAEMSIKKSQSAFSNYRRPCVRFDEQSLVPELDGLHGKESPYPSVQATYGWLLGMLLVEICPDKQDQILARGYEFGTSSIIAGYNWYSDVQAGRHLASTLMIFFHTQNGFTLQVKMARDEYDRKAATRASTRADGYLTYEDLPNPVNYLPAPPDDTSSLFTYDISQYIDGQMQRYTSRGEMAKNDCNSSVSYMCNYFSSAFGKKISESETPEIFNLVSRVSQLAGQSCTVAKNHYNRLRPYVLFNEPTIYPEDEDDLRDNGSYPSGHAAFGWLIGLTLSEINPTAMNNLMSQAYEYGQSRVIAGYHFQSDVDAGRLTAGAAFARLHAESEYLDQLEKAMKEFKGGTSGVRSAQADNNGTDTPLYNISGMRLEHEPTQHGIYIQGNKKIAY